MARGVLVVLAVRNNDRCANAPELVHDIAPKGARAAEDSSGDARNGGAPALDPEDASLESAARASRNGNSAPCGAAGGEHRES